MKYALFKTGDLVRYLGTRNASSGFGFDPEMKPSIYPEMEAEIVETKPPQKGLGALYIDGEWIKDLDEDGYNVYRNKYGRGAIIWPDSAEFWELIQ